MKFGFSVFNLLIIFYLPLGGQNLSAGAGLGGFSSYVKISNELDIHNYKTSFKFTPCINILIEPKADGPIYLRTGIIIHGLWYDYEIKEKDSTPGSFRTYLKTTDVSRISIDVNFPILLSYKKSMNSGILRFEAGPYIRASFMESGYGFRMDQVDFKPFSGGICLSAGVGSKKLQLGVISLINLSNNLEPSSYSSGGRAGNYVIELNIMREFPLKGRRE
jgi:hypothetical protein